ncbi:hypothetical protein A3C87_01835 [Candidatus Kaiserbacteria bacterium RIFCSPHIGHO2_02_FULL_49_34]|uniref:Rhodanese domain-containing protein n=1 Tax=Candidatus Kaiserbacteria bacterium RIFCSPHIGHO2_02_FULL_49_34 TaxID=1798491 RepID=A0A1F6DKP7_9BACT|nr:MAG: hypothetical protein A3C87_01835 [Candidatus Kaiserbacteria bacterium RIFCSPHIGHO2_02_FULL_49_34]
MKNITPQELNALLRRGGDAITLIDVRTPEEYSAGHIAGSRNIPLNLISGALAELKNNAGTVYVNCAAGGRSMQACEILTQNGIDAVNLVGGITAWASEGFEIV